MLAVRELERIDARALAAVRFVDPATGFAVATPLRLTAPPTADLMRNRSGLYIVRGFAPLAAHTEAFPAPPATPAIGSVPLVFEVDDPAGVYLRRRVRLDLPRDAAPENTDAENSVFRPVDVELYRSPAAPLGANWAALRMSLTERASGDALAGALVRVVSNGSVLARGLSDDRGEAVVAVVGVPITTWSEDEAAVIVTEISATVEIFFDASAGSMRVPAAQPPAHRQSARGPAPDPQAIERNPAARVSTVAVSIAAGRPLALALALDLPG
jgi:hypothetical protein